MQKIIVSKGYEKMAENKKLITADNSFLTYMGRIDLSDKMLEAAAKKFNDSRIKLWQGDFNEFAKKDFDCAFVYSAYPHFPDKAAFAEKIHSVLKPDGRFVIAHSESRHEINHRHSQGAEHVSDILAPVSEERVYFDKLFNIDITVDTDYMYIISGTKKC